MDFDRSDSNLYIAIRWVFGDTVINLRTKISAKHTGKVFNKFARFADDVFAPVVNREFAYAA